MKVDPISGRDLHADLLRERDSWRLQKEDMEARALKAEALLKTIKEMVAPIAEGNPDDAANVCCEIFDLIQKGSKP